MPFPSRQDYFRAARDAALIANAALSADAVERDGTDINVILAAGSAMADKVTGQLMAVSAGLFLDSAQQQALDRLVFDRYGLVRKPAAPALVNVNFSTGTPATAGFTIPAGTVLSTSDGIQFATLVATSIAAGSSGPVFVPATSLLAGSGQQIKAGVLTSIVSQIAGAPSNLLVTNNDASAGAADRESDQSLRNRARQFWTTSQRGTLQAIVNGALATPGVVTANALEVLDGNARPGRWVLCIVTDAYTDGLAQLNTTTPTYQAQSQALATSVFQTLNNYRCCGIFVQVIVAQVSMLQVTLALTFAAGVNTLAVANQAQAAVAGYVNGLAPGAAFVPANALAALRQVAGLVITGNEIVTPVGTVVPNVLQVLRTTQQLVGASTFGGLPIGTNLDPDMIVLPGALA
jgi:uncharacterized phage protein gp47/JayE